MKTLLKNGIIVNVFTQTLEKADVLIENDKIIGVGDYDEADVVENMDGKYICPGFIDGHIHIESTMLTPCELARVSLLHGTTSVVADPHEIANVCGVVGIDYMLEASNNIPMTVYVMLPSCVPATPFDDSGATIGAEDLIKYYENPRVLGLAEVMNYPGVIGGDKQVLRKISDAKKANKTIDGHAPHLTGRDLDRYISAGINSDHECTSFEEGTERIRKGQWVMIRQGTAAKNLEDLVDLFDEPWNRRCILVTDDKHPTDLISNGHIDNTIRQAVRMGKSAITAICMATIQAAQCFGLRYVGAVAPGYRADLLVLDSIDDIDITDVYCGGERVVRDKRIIDLIKPTVNEQLNDRVRSSFDVDKLKESDFHINETDRKCRVIKTIPNQLLTEEWITEIDFSQNNGIDTGRDILKLAVIERHKHTGHRSVGFVSGIGLKRGAVATSVSHDSHNIIVVGTNETDMACAVNRIIAMHGGCVAAEEGKIKAEVELPIAGLMSDCSAYEVAEQFEELEKEIKSLGTSKSAPLMTMSFMSLAVIPELKMTAKGLVDVKSQSIVPLSVSKEKR